AEQIVASDPVAAAAEQFAQATGARLAADNKALVTESEVVFLAVKPQHFAAAVEAAKGAFKADQLVVSIMAGVSTATMAQRLGSPRIVRVMPNTPCLIGQGASGYCLGPRATAADGELVGRLLGAVGIAYRLDEKLLDVVTGLSGSGPAFVYVMIEALSDG